MHDDRDPLTLRIATFNVETLGEPESGGLSLDERLGLLRPQMLRLRADVLCLQEVDSQRSGKGGKRSLEALDSLLAGTPYAGYHRLATTSRSKGVVRDKHNLVVLSRFPLINGRQVFHDFVAPLTHRRITDHVERGEDVIIEWDRPFLHAVLDVGMERPLHVINVHLRAPRAAWLPGGKTSARTWRTMAGWAEGFFVAAVKRAGQALEVRLLVDTVFDGDAAAQIVVCGDFNADHTELPVRTIRGDEEDAGNPHLAGRMLVPLERSLADSRRFTVVHHGRPQMLDHVLVSRPLLAWYRGIEIHNEALGDEMITAHAVLGSPESFHAPVVATFEREDGAHADAR
jgi:endonuclease/exonuclease/phosphatase family metal-dependent hydrolase